MSESLRTAIKFPLMNGSRRFILLLQTASLTPQEEVVTFESVFPQRAVFKEPDVVKMAELSLKSGLNLLMFEVQTWSFLTALLSVIVLIYSFKHSACLKLRDPHSSCHVFDWSLLHRAHEQQEADATPSLVFPAISLVQWTQQYLKLRKLPLLSQFGC